MAFFDRFRKKPEEEPAENEAVMPVDQARMTEWGKILTDYKNNKSMIEQKIRSNEEFWRMRQWKGASNINTPATAWLFTCIQSKLADVMDSYPTANFVPRQKDDEPEAKMLSAIVPVIMRQNDFETTYKNVAEYVLKNGVGVFKVYWDSAKHHGLGDIAIDEVGIFNIFWEPGITDIQKSSYVFVVENVDRKLFESTYPEAKGKISRKNIEVARFITDEHANLTEKVAVVDVYYKQNVNGRTVLHYAKYADTTLLFASENEPMTYPNGWYDHGLYPFVVSDLYHIEQSLYGIGMVDIGADAQLQIDQLNEAIVTNALMGAMPRYFTTLDTSNTEEDLANWRKQFVKVASINEQNTREIEFKPLQGNYMEFLNMKTEELKYITSNQDVNNGAAPSGITAASAIAALQETSGKNSRSINKTFYVTYCEIIYQVVELIRQFYDVPRQFRIIPDVMTGQAEYVSFDNTGLREKPLPVVPGQETQFRVPEFDIEVTAEKANTYKKMEQNELALSFYGQGFFNPQMADQALACLDMMDFDRKQDVMEKIAKNQTLAQLVVQYQQLAMALAQKYGDVPAMQTLEMAAMQNAAVMGAAPAIPPSGATQLPSESGEPKHVEKARERARNSTEVDG